MAKCSIALGLAVFFGLASIGLMISTIILATDDDHDEPKPTTPTTPTTPPLYNVRQPRAGKNICEGKKIAIPNSACYDGEDISGTVPPQSGANVTEGYAGKYDTNTYKPITDPYFKVGLCPVNVHWHLGTEHTSVGQYDEDNGTGPTGVEHRRKLAGKVRKGGQCLHYDESVEMFTKPFDWQHCVDMEVGQTYEVHWPHSMHGDCGTVNQYQEPFYDGVFCRVEDAAKDIYGATYPSGDPRPLQHQVGVQGQVFVIVNDEEYFYPDLIKGMIVDGDMGKDIAYYSGSTTGTSRNNTECSFYGPITWQVDRVCHKISASSFDKMCADMKSQRDDMSGDLYAHGSRIVVDDELAHPQEP